MTTVVRAGTLIDGLGGDSRRNVTIEIDGEVIRSLNAAVPRDATVIDAGDLTVMPGLIDCHAHLWTTPTSLEELINKPYSLLAAEALRNAQTTIDAGFTSVRDAGGTPQGVKLAIARGIAVGPRLRIAVAMLSQTGGHGDRRLASGVVARGDSSEHPVTVVDGVPMARRAARELLRAGADQIKIATSGGVMSPSDDPMSPAFCPDEIAAIVYEAHAARKTVMSHAQALEGIRNAVLAGVESIEHGIFLDEEVCQLMKSKGTYLVPTLVAPHWVLRRSRESPASIPPWAVRKAKEVVDAHRTSFRMALQLDVPIAFGTDSGVGPHGTNGEEFSLMVQSGMTPMQAIIAATRTAAQCAGLGPLTGTVEPGKRADLVAVRGLPLEDISLLAQPDSFRLVLRDGVVLKDLDARWRPSDALATFGPLRIARALGPHPESLPMNERL